MPRLCKKSQLLNNETDARSLHPYIPSRIEYSPSVVCTKRTNAIRFDANLIVFLYTQMTIGDYPLDAGYVYYNVAPFSERVVLTCNARFLVSLLLFSSL